MKEKILEFYVNKFNYLNSIDGLDLNFIPPVIRRRMSALDKLTLSTLNKTYTDNIQYIVFSSRFGQVDRLLKIIDQYKEYKEVSPNAFSGSVHNYSASFFLLNQKNAIPYTSLSAGDHSISMGLLYSVVAGYDNVLFCYADVNNGKCNSLAINIAKKMSPNATPYNLKLESNNTNPDEYEKYLDLFNGGAPNLRTPDFIVERLL